MPTGGGLERQRPQLGCSTKEEEEEEEEVYDRCGAKTTLH